MIAAVALGKVYRNGTEALVGLSVTINTGELVYLIGASGAGKTTFLKLLLQVEHPTTGQIFIQNCQIMKAPGKEVRKIRRQTGAVLQDFKLIGGRTALENVALSLRVQGVPWSEIRPRSLAALEEVGLGHKGGILVEALSWGERQRVALARAVVRRPALLLADEPTGNLDAANVAHVAHSLGQARATGATLLVATHDSRLVEQLPGRVLVLVGGHLVQDIPHCDNPEPLLGVVQK